MSEERYVKADDAIYELTKYFGFSSVRASVAASSIIDSVPTADVVPVVHGRFVKGDLDDWTCSECGEYCYSDDRDEYDPLFNFCPYCGAKMDEEAEE